MGAREILRNPEICPSIAWSAVQRLYGPSVVGWEPDTFRIELVRRFPETLNDVLVAKLLAAQTIATTRRWTLQFDGLFALALVCDGVVTGSDELPVPSPEQLSWAMHEIAVLSPEPLTDESGFDPDHVDAAVAMLLLDAGFVIPPTELAFCRPTLDQFTYAPEELRRQVTEAWTHLDGLPLAMAESVTQDTTDEDELGVAVRRLVDVKRYVDAYSRRRTSQRAALDVG